MSRLLTRSGKDALRVLVLPGAALRVTAYVDSGYVEANSGQDRHHVEAVTTRALERKGFITCAGGDWRTSRRYVVTDAGRAAFARSRA